MARDLGVDAIQTLFWSHQCGDADDRLIAERPYLDLRSILERCCHRRHPLFEEIETVDQVARIFDFMFQLEFDRLQTKALNEVPGLRLQRGGPVAALGEVILVFRESPTAVSMRHARAA